jgi:hypothetical protein
MLFKLQPNKAMLGIYLPGLYSRLNDALGNDYRRGGGLCFCRSSVFKILFKESNATINSDVKKIMDKSGI